MLVQKVNTLLRACLFGLLAGWANSLCCPALFSSSCPMPLMTSLYQCCSYAECDVFCCNCRAECRVKNCDYELVNLTFANVTDPETVISNVIYCDEDTPSCKVEFRVGRAFEETVSIGGQLSIPVLRLISAAFTLAYNDSVTEKTETGMSVHCRIKPGMKGWLSMTPQFASLTSAYVHTCCNESTCDVIEKNVFVYRKPIINMQGFNAGEIFCRASYGERNSVLLYAEKL